MLDPTRRNEIADDALRLWRGDSASLRLVADYNNLVFAFIRSGEPCYLRLISSKNRTREQIEAEVDFIAHLDLGGVRVALPIASSQGNLLEVLPTADGSLFAAVFENADGEQFAYDSAEDAREHFRLRGKTLGRIHRLSKNYFPPENFRRFAWDEDKLLLEAEEYLPASETIVWREFRALRETLRNYPKSIQSYGLIHGDFGETNYRFEKTSERGAERLNVFDFDDCCYHWFAYDLAVSIYPHGWRREGLQLLDRLLEGYAENMPLTPTLEEITTFCRWRLVYMFLVYARKWGFENLSERQAVWFAQKRENIRRGYEWQT